MKRRHRKKIIQKRIQNKFQNSNLINFILYTCSVIGITGMILTLYISNDDNKEMKRTITELKKHYNQLEKKNKDLIKDVEKLEMRAIERYKNPNFKLEETIIYYGQVEIIE